MKQPKPLAYLLLPFALIWQFTAFVRAFLFKNGHKSISHVEVPVVSVGNLAVGGSGKTPFCAYLTEKLHQQPKAVVSRGYGRQAKQLVTSPPSPPSPTLLGDELTQLKLQYPQIMVAAHANRLAAIRALQQRPTPPKLVILDDAYQNQYVHRNANLLLSDFNRPFFADRVLPVGRLREARHAANRATAVVFTRCPQRIGTKTKLLYQKKVEKYVKPNTPIFFTTMAYGTPVLPNDPANSLQPHTPIVAFCGIAHPDYFFSYLSLNFNIVQQIALPDHQTLLPKHIKKITKAINAAGKNAVLVTTQKDWARLQQPAYNQFISEHRFCYIPIKVEFLENENQFLKTLTQQL